MSRYYDVKHRIARLLENVGCERRLKKTEFIRRKLLVFVYDLICIFVIHRLMFNNWKQVD